MNEFTKEEFMSSFLHPHRAGLLPGAIALLLASLFIAPPAATAQEEEGEPGHIDSLDLAFVNHLEAELIEQDVFVEREAGSNEVFRVTKAFNDMNARLFKAAVKVPHDPFNEEAIGPHPKGEAIGMTMGEWLKQKGTGTYTCKAGEGTLETSFSGLVPNGVYTMWHSFIALPPTEPFSGTLDLPLGARDGSESVFNADAEGNAMFDRTFKPCLEMSDVWTTSMLALNWHSDGKTYKAHPGKPGKNAHIPLFVMLPVREGIE